VGTTIVIVAVYSVVEGFLWGKRWGFQAYLLERFGYEYHDFAGSVVIHACGGWVALGACWVLGPRIGRFPLRADQPMSTPPPSSVPWLSLGTWALIVGWFGFNVMSARVCIIITHNTTPHLHPVSI
jgi:Amt family ammonium transporter